MTRREAAEKVAKLRRLARGTSNPHEAAAALEQAEKIAREAGVDTVDLVAGQTCAAFDEMVDEVNKLAHHLPDGMFGTGSVVQEVLRTVRTVGETDKVARVRQVKTLVGAAHLLFGDHPTVANLKAVVDKILKNHELPTT